VTKTTFLVTTTKISLIHVLSSVDQNTANNPEVLCSLRWKLGKLVVSHKLNQKNHLEPLENFQWLKSCLDHSSIQAVCIDLDLGNYVLQLWADACQKAKKPIFIRVPSANKLPQNLYPIRWAFKRFADRIIAVIFIILLSPIIFILILLIRLNSPGPVFCQKWSVGQRGRLFQLIKFRTTANDINNNFHPILDSQQDSKVLLDGFGMTRIGYWMHRYRLDSLPQLFNVLRGDMSIVGSKSLDLYHATQIDQKNRSHLRTIPGIISIFDLDKSLKSSDKFLESYFEKSYLSTWSLQRDLKALLKSILNLFLIA
jgi:lipopolysaccharide/colanic/teichoic acid biosynthesis glycosyltransferase